MITLFQPPQLLF